MSYVVLAAGGHAKVVIEALRTAGSAYPWRNRRGRGSQGHALLRGAYPRR